MYTQYLVFRFNTGLIGRFYATDDTRYYSKNWFLRKLLYHQYTYIVCNKIERYFCLFFRFLLGGKQLHVVVVVEKSVLKTRVLQKCCLLGLFFARILIFCHFFAVLFFWRRGSINGCMSSSSEKVPCFLVNT
jgi:hypothetical protein